MSECESIFSIIGSNDRVSFRLDVMINQGMTPMHILIYTPGPSGHAADPIKMLLIRNCTYNSYEKVWRIKIGAIKISHKWLFIATSQQQ